MLDEYVARLGELRFQETMLAQRTHSIINELCELRDAGMFSQADLNIAMHEVWVQAERLMLANGNASVLAGMN